MDLQDFVKKYVWDDEKTPYFRSVKRLTRKQANNELFVYACFLIIIFLAGELVALSRWTKGGETTAIFIAIYSSAVIAGALSMWRGKARWGAWICLTAPIAAFMNFYFDGLQAGLETIDKYFLIILSLLWLRYSVRTLSIVRHYVNMPQGKPLE